jgi:hypothetical protein
VAKANIVLPNGTSVEIEGSPEEVAELLAQFSGASAPGGKAPKRATKQRARRKFGGRARKGGPTVLIGQLADEGYFKSKRSIGDIQKKLQEGGHIYPLTSISPCLTRMTKRRQLRRLKADKVWMYVA